MSSKSETGHARNVGNLKTMVAFLESLEQAYRPANTALAIEMLKVLISESEENVKTVNAANVKYIKAVDARQQAFAPLAKLTTRIANALVSCKADKRIIDAAALLNKKISGSRTAPKKTEEQKEAMIAAGKSAKEASTSQMSFDLRIENFGKLIILLKETPQYAPNEEDLTMASLEALLDRLNAANENVGKYAGPLDIARIRRNEIMYAPDKGIPDTAKAVKSYIKSAFGATSPQYKKIGGIKFTRTQ